MGYLVQGGAPPDDSVTTAKIQDDAVTSAKVAAGVLPGKNLIINGDMRIAQRGTSFVSPSSNDYTLDRFKVNFAGAVATTITQDTDVPNETFHSSLKIDITTADASLAAGDFFALTYNIEGLDAVPLAFGTSDAQTFTLSFWVKSPKTGTHSVGLRNNAVDRGYAATYSVSSADTWEKKSINITADTTGTWLITNGAGVVLSFMLASGSTFHASADDTWEGANVFASSSQVNCLDNTANNFFITGVQLEVGSAASDFEHRDYATELARCQRYFLNITGESIGIMYANNTIEVTFGYRFPVQMRASPTLAAGDTSPNITDGGSGFTGSGVNNKAGTADGSGMLIALTGFTGLTQYRLHYDNGSAEPLMTCAAEL